MAKSKTKTEVGTASVSTVKLPREKVVRDRLLEAKGALENGYLEMAQLISEAFHKEFHLNWGFGTFREYCEQELEIGYHKATYFMDIWDKVKTLELPKSKVTKLGWTKMKDIAAVVTKENAEELLEKASSMSSRELTETVKTMRKSDPNKDKNVPVTVTFSVKMGESEHRVVLDAIEEAKKLLETDQTTLALETICSDWMEAKGGQPTVTALEDYIAYLENVFPVKISFKSVKKAKASKPVAPPEEEEDEAPPKKAAAKKGKKGAEKGAKPKKAAKKVAPVEDEDQEDPLADDVDVDSYDDENEDADINALLGLDDDE